MTSDIMANAWGFGPFALLGLLSAVTLFFGVLVNRRRVPSVRLASPMFLAIALNLAMLTFRVLVDEGLIDDEISWHQDGILVSEFLAGRSPSIEDQLGAGKAGYAWLVGFIYYLAGPAPFIPVVLNILLLVLLVPIVTLIAEISTRELRLSRIQVTRAARIASYMIAAMPAIIFWAPRLLREIPSMFLIAVAVLALLLFLENKSTVNILVLICAILGMVSIRAQIGVGLAAAVSLASLAIWSMRFRSVVTRAIVVLPVFLLVLIATWATVDASADIGVENTAYRNRALTDATSAFTGAEELQHADSVLDIVFFNLPRILFGPFPNEVNASAVMLLALGSSFFWVCSLLLASVVLTRRKALSHDNAKWSTVIVLVTVTLMLILALSFNAGNYGLVIRMRLMPFVTLIPLAALGHVLLISGVHFTQRPGRASRKNLTEKIPRH